MELVSGEGGGLRGVGGDWRGQIGRLELDLVELVSGGGGRSEGSEGLEGAYRPARAGPGGVVSGEGEVRGEWGGIGGGRSAGSSWTWWSW